MSTAVATSPLHNINGVKIMEQTLRKDLQQIVDDILGLRALAETTGFMTFKSQREILARLTPADQASVGHALAKAEARKQPIVKR
jgi:hypothetical protein